MIKVPVEWVEFERQIMSGDDASTCCGSVHDRECLERHKSHCRVCDEDGEYHGEDD